MKFMNPKLLLCLALVLSSGLVGCSTITPRSAENAIKPREIEFAVPQFNEVIFSAQTNLYEVNIVWGIQDSAKPLKEPDADVSNIRVWLLQPNGTCIPQNVPPGFCWTGHMGTMLDDNMNFSFTRVATNKVVGIVLRYRGKLYCKEIEDAE